MSKEEPLDEKNPSPEVLHESPEWSQPEPYSQPMMVNTNAMNVTQINFINYPGFQAQYGGYMPQMPYYPQ